jgi:hypothetical protein
MPHSPARSSRRLPLKALLLACLALAVPATAAVAAPPGKPRPLPGSTYEGGIVLHPSTGTVHVPFEFDVSNDGERVGPFTIKYGAPGSPGCQLGPIGFPVRELAPINKAGRFSIGLRLISPGEPNHGENLGEVVIAGHFLAGGKATGTIETKGVSKVCAGTFRWSAAAH